MKGLSFSLMRNYNTIELFQISLLMKIVVFKEKYKLY